MKKLLLICLLSVVSGTQEGRIDWCKIIPFQTTRAEIEMALGPPIRRDGYVLSYDSRNERLTVWYGGAKPRKSDPCKWNLSEDTVFSFVYVPKENIPLTKLNIDLTKFKKEKAVEMVNDFYYYNPTEGLTLTTRLINGEEILLSVERNPNEKLREKYCTHQ